MSIALADLALINKGNFVGSWTGRFAGFSPLMMRRTWSQPGDTCRHSPDHMRSAHPLSATGQAIIIPRPCAIPRSISRPQYRFVSGLVLHCGQNIICIINVGEPARSKLDTKRLSRSRGCIKPVFSVRPFGLPQTELQATMQKTALAERILKSAARGERDRKRLRAVALDLAA
jgi:hypothetical protein